MTCRTGSSRPTPPGPRPGPGRTPLPRLEAVSHAQGRLAGAADAARALGWIGGGTDGGDVDGDLDDVAEGLTDRLREHLKDLDERYGAALDALLGVAEVRAERAAREEQ